MIKHIIFDFDDTLCLTEAQCFILENHTASLLGYPPMTHETHQSNWGVMFDQAIAERFPGIDVAQFMIEIEKLIPEYIKAGKYDAIPEKNLQTIDRLREKNLQTSVITSRSFKEVSHLLTPEHVLHGRIDAFYHKDNSHYHKPDPKVFDEILARFDLEPHHAVYVGDAPGDAIAAKSAGLYFIALLEGGVRKKTDFKNLDVDFFVEEFTQIEPIINNL